MATSDTVPGSVTRSSNSQADSVGLYGGRGRLLTLGELDARYPAATQSFALANLSYKTLQSWTVTGQTDDPLPPFGTVAGSQTYGTSPPIQGPAFWMGFNPVFLSGQANPGGTHGAAGISVFADAGDSNNGAGRHGIEVNPATFACGSGGKATNAIQMVAIDDATNTVNTVIRCGTGTSNGVTSNITFQNADATTTFMTMSNATAAVTAGVPLTVSAAGAGAPASLSSASATGTGQLILSGNNASTVHATVNLQKSGVNKWQFAYLDPTFLYINSPAAPAGVFALWEPASTYATSLAIFFSQLQTYDSVICGNAALALNATTGFLYLPSCAGVPTGTPAAKTGTVPCVLDSTDSKLYAYIGGAWKSVTLA